jgi:hypothetical protein
VNFSDAALASLQAVQRPRPFIREVEDRHVEDKQRIVSSPAPLEYFSPSAPETSLRSFHFLR